MKRIKFKATTLVWNRTYLTIWREMRSISDDLVIVDAPMCQLWDEFLTAGNLILLK